jgi:aminoglycoside 6'-N-acetyltransferase I
MRAPLRIRPIAPEDLDAWCRMRQALWPDAEAKELRREAEACLAGEHLLGAVLVGDGPSGEALGMLELSLRSYAEGCRTAPVPYIEAWYVVPKARRRGVGQALVAAAEQWARARGYREIASDTVLDNRIAERAHLALGFAEVERAIHFRKDLAAVADGDPASGSGET